MILATVPPILPTRLMRSAKNPRTGLIGPSIHTGSRLRRGTIYVMPLTGEYEPSTASWARRQAERYEASGGADAGDLALGPVVRRLVVDVVLDLFWPVRLVDPALGVVVGVDVADAVAELAGEA